MNLRLGDHSYELSTRPLVMGVLNRTPDSFFDRGAYFSMEEFLARAERLVAAGADILDVGGVRAGPGPEVGIEEELERVVPAIEALHTRYDLPISVDTWRAEVAKESYGAGAVMGNDISGLADSDYLPVSVAAGASVVVTHIRLAPRIPDPDPCYSDLLGEVSAFLRERALRAEKAGLARDQIVLDAGLDLGKTWKQSLRLLRASDHLANLGYPLLLSASNKPFLGHLFGIEVDDREEASLATAALGVCLGCRIVRTHDVAGTKRVCKTLSTVMEAA